MAEPAQTSGVPDELLQWWQLPTDDRRAVLGLSRSGRHHPDAGVAWTAWRWAQVVLPPGAPEPGRARNILSAAGFFAHLTFELVSGGASPENPPAPHWLDRRRARRIMRLGPPVR